MQLTVPAGPALVAAAEALRTAVASHADDRVVHEAARATGQAWIDALLDGFVLPLAAASRGRPNAGQRTAATVHDLGERLIDQAIRRADQARIAAFLAFLDARLDAGGALSAPIEPAHAAVLDAADAGPDHLAAALHATIDAALRRFLDEPLAALGVGMLTSAAVKIGRFAIGRRTHREVEQAVRDPAAAARLSAALAGFVATAHA